MTSSGKTPYSASFAFFEAIWEAGVTHCFVNLGSDHPSFMEAMVQGQKEKKDSFPRIITCPNEMVALSMADGMARLTGKPQCVIVHVDVGTQALAAAMHNASVGRCPILIFAGLSPYTLEGEYRGSRTEYIHWLQDAPDQKAIVAQFCRYTGEIKRGKNVKQMVNRALQFATSDPKGPVYLYGAREAMEEEIDPYDLDQTHWTPIQPTALPEKGVKLISDELESAKSPLLIVGYTGRNPDAVKQTVILADTIPALRVLDTGACEMCFPSNHPAWLGTRMGVHPAIEEADLIVVIDCDVPWIPTQCKPKKGTKVVHIDVDPLKPQMSVHYIPAFARFQADSTTALAQINHHHAFKGILREEHKNQESNIASRQKRQEEYEARIAQHQSLAKLPSNLDSSPINPHALGSQIRAAVPEDTIFCVEAVTLTPFIADQLAPVHPKSYIHCAGGGLGWSGGGSLGVKLATDHENRNSGKNRGKFVCQVVGDGCFMFTVPSSVYWIAQRYDIPVLTIVLSNKGWNAPRRSLLLVHPDGEGSKVSNRELNISFEPTPDYAGIAKAAAGGKCWAGKCRTVAELLKCLPEAVAAVEKEGVCAVLEVVIDGDGRSG